MSEAGPALAVPPRPPRRLSILKLTKAAMGNALAACDEELYESLFVERRFLWLRFFSICDPEGIRRVMQENVDNYPRFDTIRRVFEYHTGTGILSSDGEVWRHHRRALNPTLDHRTILTDVPAIAQTAESLADILATLPAGQKIDLRDMFRRLLFETTSRLFDREGEDIRPVLSRLWEHIGPYRLSDLVRFPGWLRPIERSLRQKNRRTARALLPQVDRLIAQRRGDRSAGAKDLLWRIVHAVDPQSGTGLDHPDLRDEVMTLGAGSETTVGAYPWLWYLLALHPAVEARLHAELHDVLGGRSPTAEDLPRLVYLRRIVDETLRLYPSVPTVLRTARADDIVCGRRVPRGSVVAVMPWLINRHRKLWTDPERFDPDRFAPEQVRARSRYAYLPFSMGPHVCIGAALAINELMISTAILAQRFRFRLVPGRKIEPVAWTNLYAKGGIWVTLERRPPIRIAVAVRTAVADRNPSASTIGRDAP